MMATLSTSSLKVCASRTGKGCGKSLPISDFYKEKSKAGVRAICKDCCRAETKSWRKVNPEKASLANQRSRAKAKLNPELATQRAKNTSLKYLYGISLKEYNELIMTQCGQCAVCDEIPSVLYVHHDHNTGEVVSLLCNKCNIGIGMLRDSAKLLKRAAEIQEGR